MSTEREIKVGVNLDGSKARRESKKTAKQIKKDFGGLSKAQYEATEKEFGGDKMIKALNAESAAANKATAPLQRLTNVTKQLKYPLQASALKTNEFSRSQQNVVNTLSNSGTGLATLGDAGEKLSGTQRSMANYIDSSTRALKKFGATGKNIGAITRVVDKSYKGMNTGIDSLGMNLVKISPAIGDTTAKFGGITDQMAGLTSISGAVSASLNNVSAKGSNFRVLEDAFTKLLKPLPQVSDGFKGLDINAQRLATSTKKSTNAFANLKSFFTGFRMELLGMGFMFTTIGTILTGITKQATASFSTIGDVLTKSRVAFIELQGSLKNLLFQFADSEAMENFLKFLNGLLTTFLKLPPDIKEAIYSLIIWGGVIATILGLMSFMLLGIFAIVAGIFAWGGALTSLKAAIGAIIAGEGIPGITAALAGGGGLVAILSKAITNFLYWGFVILVLIGLLDLFGKVLDWSKNHLNKTGTEGSKSIDLLGASFDFVLLVISSVVKAILGILLMLVLIAATIIMAIVEIGIAMVETVGFFLRNWQNFFDYINAAWAYAVQFIAISLKGVVNSAGEDVQNLANAFIGMVKTIVSTLKGFAELVNLALRHLPGFVEMGIQIDTGALDAIEELNIDFSTTATNAKEAEDLAKKLAEVQRIQGLISGDAEAGLSRYSAQFEGVVEGLREIGFIGGDLLKEIPADIQTFLDKLSNKVDSITPQNTDAWNDAFKPPVNEALKMSTAFGDTTSSISAFQQKVNDFNIKSVDTTQKMSIATETIPTLAETKIAASGDFEDLFSLKGKDLSSSFNLEDQTTGLYSSVVDQAKGSDLANITIGDFSITNDISVAGISGQEDLDDFADQIAEKSFEKLNQKLDDLGVTSE